MEKEVFLHIGIPKTGTSAIQKYMFDSRHELINKSFLYPNSGILGIAHYDISTAFREIDNDNKTKKHHQILENLISEINKTLCTKVLISSEAFVKVKNIKNIKDWLGKYSVKILIYLRRHDHWWQSMYSQAAKQVVNPPWPIDIQGYLDYSLNNPNLRYSNYSYFVDSWSNIFGKENVIVRVYEKEQNIGGIIPDFLDAIGVDSLSNDHSKHYLRINKSLDPKTIYMLSIVNRMNLSLEDRGIVKKYLIDNSLPSSENFDLLGPDLRKEIIYQNNNSYSYIAKNYLNNTNGILFQEKMPQENKLWQPFQQPDLIETINCIFKALGL